MEEAGLLWLANPVLFYSWIKIKDIKHSLIGSGFVVGLCLLFILFKKTPNPGVCGSFLEPMPCSDIEITEIKLGYVLWLLSAIVLFIGNCIRYILNK